MSAFDDLRLAWLAERGGRHGRRDALLTLAVASAGPADMGWAERIRRRLIAARPDHPFAAFATREAALADPGVAGGLDRLRTLYPPGRVRRLLARADALRGPYTGRPPTPGPLLDDLFATPVMPRPRTSRPQPVASDSASNSPAPAERLGLPPGSDPSLAGLYLRVLLTIALLLEDVLRRPGEGSRAA